MSITSKAQAEHYSWGGACDGWRLVQRPECAVIEERMPAGAAEVRHYHRQARQFFYVLSGCLSLEVEGEVQRVEPRHGLEIPPGARHRASNAGPEPVEFILFSVPPTQGDRVNLD